MKKALIIITLLLALFVINTYSPFGITINGSCDYVGGWNSHSRSCKCSGTKTVISDSLAVDGAYETICNGIGLISRR